MPIMRQRAFHIAPGTENQIPITPTLYTANPQVNNGSRWLSDSVTLSDFGKPSCKKSAVFLNIVQKAFDPPTPPFIWTSCGEFFMKISCCWMTSSTHQIYNIIFEHGFDIHPKKDFCCGDGHFGQKKFAEKNWPPFFLLENASVIAETNFTFGPMFKTNLFPL